MTGSACVSLTALLRVRAQDRSGRERLVRHAAAAFPCAPAARGPDDTQRSRPASLASACAASLSPPNGAAATRPGSVVELRDAGGAKGEQNDPLPARLERLAAAPPRAPRVHRGLLGVDSEAEEGVGRAAPIVRGLNEALRHFALQVDASRSRVLPRGAPWRLTPFPLLGGVAGHYNPWALGPSSPWTLGPLGT